MPVNWQPLWSLEFWGPCLVPFLIFTHAWHRDRNRLWTLLPDSSPGSVSYSLTGKLAQFSEPRCPHLETGVQLGWPSKNTRKGPSTEQTLPEPNKWPSSTLCHHLPSPRPHLFGLESFPLTSWAGHSSADNSHIASGPRRMPRPFL